MVVWAEKAPPAQKIEYIPLEEFPGLESTILRVNGVLQHPRFKGEGLEAAPFYPEDVKIVAEQEDFIYLQRETLFPRSQLHPSAQWFYRKLDQDYGGTVPLVAERGCLIVPETGELFLSSSFIDGANSLVDKTRDEKGQRSDFLLSIGSFLLRENLRRMAACHISAEPHLADLALNSFASHLLQTAEAIKESWPQRTSALINRIDGLRDRFSRDLAKAKEEGSFNLDIEGAKMAVFIEDELLLRTGFWLDRQIAEMVSSRFRVAFVKAMVGESQAKTYIDKFNAERKSIAGIGGGDSLLIAYLDGKIPLTFAQKYPRPYLYI